MVNSQQDLRACACGSGQCYSDCCGPFISGQATAPTAEALMRSRYTAYTLADMDYIARTMKAPANEHFDPETARQWATQSRWIKLEILRAHHDENHGVVEFRAHYAYANKHHVLHEISEFSKDQGQWYYISGHTPHPDAGNTVSSTGRNVPCPCGSGKKFKKCCGQ